MKKIMIASTVILGALLFAACNKVETEQQPEAKKATLTANINQDTKTYLDGVSVKWSANDKLAVFSNSDFNATQYDLIQGATTTHGVFYGDEKEGSKFLALYPYSRVTKRDDTYATVSIPRTQTYEAGSIKSNYLPMYAVGSTLDDMAFVHLGSVLKFKLYASTPTTVSKVVVKFFGLGGEHVNDVDVNINGYTTYYGGPDGIDTFTLNCDDVVLGADADHATEFNIVCMGGFTATSGFNITITASTGKMYLTKDSSFSPGRGRIISFNPIEFVPAAADPTKKVSLDGETWSTLATFAETPTSKLYVKTDGEALAASDLATIMTILNRASGGVDLDMSASTYYSDTWPATDNNHIKSIILPSNIKILDTRAFYGCMRLASIDLTNITTIKNQAFDDCAFTTLNIPANVTSLPESAWIAFYTYSLTAINVDGENPKYKSIDGVLFNKAGTKLIEYPKGKSGDSYVVPDGVTSVNEYALAKPTSFSSLTLPSTLTTITFSPYGVNWNSLSSITWNYAGVGRFYFPENNNKLPNRGALTVPNVTISYKDKGTINLWEAYFYEYEWLSTKEWTINGHPSSI